VTSNISATSLSKNMHKNLFIPVCNRTNYSKLKPIIRQFEIIEPKVIGSSSIILEAYASPIQDIVNDNVDVVSMIDCLLMNNTLESMCKTVGLSVIEHASLFGSSRPDAILVTGDRFDMLPAVLAARMMNIQIFHVQGGENSGSIDDTVRDMITVCSYIHYVSTEKAANRVSSIVAGRDGVHNMGCPAVEYVAGLPVGDCFDVTRLKKRFKHKVNIQPNEPYLLIVVHPNTLDDKDIQMDVLMDACLSFKMKCIVVYPNVDAFSIVISETIKEKHIRFSNLITVIKHAPLEDFVMMMAHASCMVGNSSAGIREAASFGVPVVNIGSRQSHRERNENTLDSLCVYQSIVEAIQLQLDHGPYGRSNVYYRPQSALNIARHIESTITGRETDL